MSRLIDADALEREGWSLCRTFQKDECTMVYEVKKPSDFPTIEERKTGKWLPEFDGAFTGGAYWFRCSECGRIVPDVRNGGWDYCPKCGARNV